MDDRTEIKAMLEYIRDHAAFAAEAIALGDLSEAARQFDDIESYGKDAAAAAREVVTLRMHAERVKLTPAGER